MNAINQLSSTAKWNCTVSFTKGRRFKFQGSKKTLTYNALVQGIFQARSTPGFNGKEAYQHLVALHQLGEKELKKQPWYTRAMTLIKRFFTSSKRNRQLKQLQKIVTPAQPLRSKRAPSKPTLETSSKEAEKQPQHLNSKSNGNATDPVAITDTTNWNRHPPETQPFYNKKGEHLATQTDLEQIKKTFIELGVRDIYDFQLYQGGLNHFGVCLTLKPYAKYLSPCIDSETVTKKQFLENLITSIRDTFLPWKNCISRLIEWSDQKKFQTNIGDLRKDDVNRFDLKLDSRTRCACEQISYCENQDNILLKILTRQLIKSNFFPLGEACLDITIDLRLQKNALESTAFNAFWEEWKKAVDMRFDNFLLDAMRKRSRPGIFNFQFEETETQFPADSIPIDQELQTVESMMNLPKDQLVALKSDVKALKNELNRLYKKGALQFHPDTAARRGITPAEIEEDFKQFEGAVKKALEWVQAKLNPSARVTPAEVVAERPLSEALCAALKKIENLMQLPEGKLEALAKNNDCLYMDREITNLKKEFRNKFQVARAAEMGMTEDELKAKWKEFFEACDTALVEL